MTANSFGSRATIEAGGASHEIYRLDAVAGSESLPYSLKILLENLLRNEDGVNITSRAHQRPRQLGREEGAGHRDPVHPGPGDPAGPDRRAGRRGPRRDARGHGEPRRRRDEDQPAHPRGTGHRPLRRRRRLRPPRRFRAATSQLEFQRNRERFQFLRWGQQAFSRFRVVPPGTGIVHQVNIEHLARVVMTDDGGARAEQPGVPRHLRRHRLPHHHGERSRHPRLGSRRHRGGGGHARPAHLHADPEGRRLPPHRRRCRPAATATDLVLTITEMLRKHGVVGKFVEFHGDGVGQVPVANRATIGNMSPEFGSTCAIFPIDAGDASST